MKTSGEKYYPDQYITCQNSGQVQEAEDGLNSLNCMDEPVKSDRDWVVRLSRNGTWLYVPLFSY